MPRPMVMLSRTALENFYVEHTEKKRSIRAIADRTPLGIAAPALYKLMNAYIKLKNGDISMEAQLFPEWIKDEPPVQRQDPNSWSYRGGSFPDGRWYKYDRDVVNYRK